MEIILENKSLQVKLNTLGAEATAIKRTDLACDYLWTGDPALWASHSPVLFPMVCAAMNGEIQVDGRKYPLNNHGYARKTEFELVESSGEKAVFRLKATEKSLAMYPYVTELTLTYALADTQLVIDYRVDNLDSRTIWFQIGTHPGFNCPLEAGLNMEDYVLEFDQPEQLERQFMNGANVLIPGKTEAIGLDNRRLPLTRPLFAAGALVFPQINSRRITLKSDRAARAVAVSFENMSQLGLWQAKDAPFVCIEPWHGLADVDGYSGEFKDRAAVVELPQGQSFTCRMVIETF